jgi:hypothetical protein
VNGYSKSKIETRKRIIKPCASEKKKRYRSGRGMYRPEATITIE